MDLGDTLKIESWIVGEEKWNLNLLSFIAEVPLIAVVQWCAIFWAGNTPPCRSLTFSTLSYQWTVFSTMHKTELHASCRKTNDMFLELATKMNKLKVRDVHTICELSTDYLRKTGNLGKHVKTSEPHGNTYVMLFLRAEKRSEAGHPKIKHACSCVSENQYMFI